MEIKIEKQTEEVLKSCFQSIPFIKDFSIQKEFSLQNQNVDFLVQLRIPTGNIKIIVEVKKMGEPRFVRNAVNQLLRLKSGMGDIYGIIISPYISPYSAQICKDAGFGYIDFSGNCYINHGQLYIEKENRPNQYLKKRVLKSIFYPKAQRVLRVLLNKPDKTWKMQELANEANVSLGLCGKVKQRLEDMEWITAHSIGFSLKNWKELLQAWQNNYDYQVHSVYQYYSLNEETRIEKNLSDYCNLNNIKYALTLFSGASRVAPFTRMKTIHAYVNDSIDAIEKELELKPVTSGANVVLMVPKDQGVFYGMRSYVNINVVSSLQLYLDLMSYKGRGEDAAEFLYKQEIEPAWSQNQITDNGK